MKKLLYILCTLTILGCTRDNFLDFQPKGIVIPSTYSDYRNLLDQVLPSQDGSISKGFGSSHTLPLVVSDDQTITDDILTASGLTKNIVNAYTFQESFYSSLEEDPDWALYYNQIYVSNVILDGLSSVTDGTTTQINELKAEAKLHRAYAYFNLVNIYSVHYNAATASTDLGVPIRKGISLEGLDFTRASVEENYAYILNDINESYDNLKDSQSINLRFRPSKAGASGLLARIYLYQGKYDLALEEANKALGYNNTIRDMNTDDQDTGYSSPIVLQPLVENNPEIIWYKYYETYQVMFASDDLISLYDTDDLRSNWYLTYSEFFGGDIDSMVLISQFFTGFYATTGITTADMLLISAECNARLGNIADANDNLNKLREKRYKAGTYTPISISDPTTLLNFVKQERRREMVLGAQRMFDIKRYNRFDNDNISLTHSLGDKTGTLAPNSLNWAFPIASKYIQLNPEIEQNPRD